MRIRLTAQNKFHFHFMTSFWSNCFSVGIQFVVQLKASFFFSFFAMMNTIKDSKWEPERHWRCVNDGRMWMYTNKVEAIIHFENCVLFLCVEKCRWKWKHSTFNVQIIIQLKLKFQNRENETRNSTTKYQFIINFLLFIGLDELPEYTTTTTAE